MILKLFVKLKLTAKFYFYRGIILDNKILNNRK